MRHGNSPSAWEQASTEQWSTTEKSAASEVDHNRSRLFDDLAPPAGTGKSSNEKAACGFDDQTLEKLSRAMKSYKDMRPCDLNDDIPAGYTYLGQFLIHDITHTAFPDRFDTGRSHADQLANMRSSGLDLDGVYGNGPEHSPILYRRTSAPRNEPRYMLRTGITGPDTRPVMGTSLAGRFLDLQRVPDIPGPGCPHAESGRHSDPLIGDARNDDHVIISQLHLLFIRAHNRIAEFLKKQGYDNRQSFRTAQKYTIKSYRYIIRFDFLSRILDEQIYHQMFSGKQSALRQDINKVFSISSGEVPIEFSMAVARFGHAMIRGSYKINDNLSESDNGDIDSVLGFSTFGQSTLPLPGNWVVDWRHFFEVDHEVSPQKSRLITPFFSSKVHAIKMSDYAGLAALDLKRSRICGLPSGQQLAARINNTVSNKKTKIPVLTGQDMLPNNARQHNSASAISQVFKNHPELIKNSPLFYYVLHEADKLTDGRHLGPLGSFVFAATINNLMKDEPEWSTAFSPENRPAHICTMRELIRMPALSDEEIGALPGLELPEAEQ